jgi:hypothetical protein
MRQGGLAEDGNVTLETSRKKPRSVNRGALAAHLPREEIVIEAESKACPGQLILVAGDSRVEMATNTVERAIRPVALNRKNALFAGHDRGAVHWGMWPL